MWILPLLGYLGVVVGFAFLTLAIGMYCTYDQRLPLLFAWKLAMQHGALKTLV
jgi:Transmembrane adaptor Erv26.